MHNAIRNLLRRALARPLTDLFSMTPWPLEVGGAGLLWAYGALFASSRALSPPFQSSVVQLMPGDLWSIAARLLALLLALVCALTWLGRVPIFGARLALAVAGLLVWSTLVYSCWRGDVPWGIYRVYVIFLGGQVYVASLLHVRRREHRSEHREEAPARGRALHGFH